MFVDFQQKGSTCPVTSVAFQSTDSFFHVWALIDFAYRFKMDRSHVQVMGTMFHEADLLNSLESLRTLRTIIDLGIASHWINSITIFILFQTVVPFNMGNHRVTPPELRRLGESPCKGVAMQEFNQKPKAGLSQRWNGPQLLTF